MLYISLTHLINKHIITLIHITCCMAPNRLNLFNHTMTNPNINTIISILNGPIQQPKPTAVGFKIVHIGTNKTPASILGMAPIDGKSWQNSLCFDSLANDMRSHMDSLSIHDLVAVVSTKSPTVMCKG